MNSMFNVRVVVLVLALAVQQPQALETNAESQANPMRKVIRMMQDMQKELAREGELEAEIFEKAMCACEGGEKELVNVVETSTSEIDSSKSKIDAGKAEESQLVQELSDHANNLEGAKADLATATELRKQEHDKFVQQDKATTLSLKQMDQAIPALEKGMSGAALVQTMSQKSVSRLRQVIGVTRYLSDDDRQAVLAFLAQGTGEDLGDSVQAPSSGQIVGILKQMRETMAGDQAEMRKSEESAASDFAALADAKKSEISTNEKAIITKEKRKGALAVELSEASHSLEDAEEELANAQKFLTNMKEECATKAKDRDMRAKMRAEEIAAISEAIKILNDDDALEVFKKAVPSAALLQRKTYDAFVQLGSRRATIHLQRARPGVSLLSTGSAHKLTEKVPQEVVDVVQGIIGGLVKELHEEDVTDEVKKVYCANETSVNEALKTSKEDELQKLTTEIEEGEDTLATLISEIKGLEESIAATDKQVFDMTAQRKEEHQEFVDAFATQGTAIKLIEKAMTRLEKFYSPKAHAAKVAAVKDAAMKKAGLALLGKSSAEPMLSQSSLGVRRMEEKLGAGFDSDSLIQTHSTTRHLVKVSLRSFVQVRSETTRRVMPAEIPDTPTTYVKSESGGVMGLMSDIKTEMKTEMAAAETEEKHAAEDYTRIMDDAKMSRTSDMKTLNQKKSEKAHLDEKLVDDKSTKMNVEEELRNLALYLLQLHHECDFILENFEVRHDDRIQKEMGLKSAETIVTKADPPSQPEVEEQYDEEKTPEDVAANFPPPAEAE